MSTAINLDVYAEAQAWLEDVGYPVTDDIRDTVVAINAYYHGGLEAFIADGS